MQEKLRDKLIKLSDELAREVYPFALKFPKYEQYALADQLRRAIISVPANIIEGFQQRTYQKILKRHLCSAYGSLGEAKYLIYFAYKQNYIDEVTFQSIRQKAESLSRLLWSLILKF